MIRVLLLALLLAVAAGAAQAQLRTIPPVAKRARMSHIEGLVVDLNGKRTELAPGVQIRDTNNRLIVPTTLPPDSLVKYVPDLHGQVWRVWILSPEEAAQPDPKN